MKLNIINNRINNIWIKSAVLFIYFFAKNISLADAVADDINALLTTTLTELNKEDSTKYPNESIYTLAQGNSSNFVITRYLTTSDSDGVKTYTPVEFDLSIDNITIDSSGTNYIYYKWDDTENRTLSITDTSNADFYIQYSSDASITDIESYLSTLDAVDAGDFYYVYEADKFAFSATNANAVYAINYESSYATINVRDKGILSISVNSDTSNLGESETWVFNPKNGNIESIEGNFYGVNITTYTELDIITSPVLFGGAIFNDYYAKIGDISGDFIANFAKSESYEVNGGVLFSNYLCKIGDITGDFVGNYAYSESGDVNGGAICNYYTATIGDITGDFIGNYGYSESGGVRGGAICNDRYDATIGDITGDFIGNYAFSAENSYGGAIYNASGIINSISGDFIGNYVKGDNILAWGGAICNTYDYPTNPSSIGDIYGNFIANYAESLNANAKGAAIYNREVSIANITGDFIANFSYASDYVLGGTIYNERGDIGNITGDFIGNYSIATSGYIEGGLFYNYYEANFGYFIGDFIGNYAEAYSYIKGALFYNYNSDIGDITGDFVGNYAIAENSYVEGGIVYNTFQSTVGNITGSFIANYAISKSSYVYGAIIYNNASSHSPTSIGDITGDFIYNYAEAYKEIKGVLIYNNSTSSLGAIIGNISGDFLGNYAYSENSYISGALICNSSTSSLKSSIGNISGDFISNYAKACSYISGGLVYNSNSSIGNISGDFIANYASSENSYISGGLIYNNSTSKSEAIIGDITGNFIGNYAISEGSYVYGAVIYNNAYFSTGSSTMGDITGDFIGNYASAYSVAYGGVIYNDYSEIGNITGNFVGNYAFSKVSSAYGAVIYNDTYATIGDITGDFIGNYAMSEGGMARGGAIYNSNSDIENITGDFIGNYVYSYKAATGGAIYCSSYSRSGDIKGNITGDFIGNYAASSNSGGIGGAIYNYSTAMNILTGDFIGNYAAGTFGVGGAIYNSSTIESIIGSFIANYTMSSTGNASGGAICNYNNIASITGDFAYNYAYSTEYNAFGGVVYAGEIAFIDAINGNFINNYAWGYIDAYGGVIYSDEGGNITCLDSTFVGNYAKATTGEAYGGAIYNVGFSTYYNVETNSNYISTINLENANFIDNYASGTSAYGGAIYNDATLNYSLGEGTYAYATGNTATTEGGFLYNAGTSSFDIATGAVFTVGVYEEDDATDSIYNSGDFIKSGAGTMLIRSNFENEAYATVAATAYENAYTTGGSVSISEGILIIEGVDESEDLDTVWFNVDVISTAISDATASFVLGTSMSLGKYLVVGTYTGTIAENTAYFASDSLFAVHVETTGGSSDYSASELSSALVGDGTSTVVIEAGAVLLVYGLSAGDDIRILEDFDGASSAYAKWDIEYISSANPLYKVDSVQWRSEESAVATISEISDDSPAISLMSVSLLRTASDESSIMTLDEDDSFAVATIDDSADEGTSLYLTTSVDEDVVSEVGQISEIGGVISNMGLILNLARDTTMARFSIFDEIFSTQSETNFGVWATPMGNYSEARGLNAGTKSIGYNMSFGGGNIGIDYTFSSAYRVGIAFHGGYGETNSQGDFSPTNNDFGFYSISLYNGFKMDKLLIYADVNFAISTNDLTQYNSSGAGNFYADVDAYAISGEIRIDYLIDVYSYNLIPHLGLNYMYLSINDYDVSFLGETVLNVNSRGQSIFSIPVGVSLSKSFDVGNDYFLSPIIDIGVAFNFGDLYSKSTASFTDISATSLSVQAYNDYSFTGLLGLECKKGNNRIALNYFIEASENIISHNFRLSYRYDF